MNRHTGVRLGSVLTMVVVLALVTAPALPAAQDARAAVAELGRVKLGADAMMPRTAAQVLPDYPADAAGARGTVSVEVVVGTKGGVIHARVADTPDSSGALGRAALEAARGWTFKPAVNIYGEYQTVLVMLYFEFEPPRAPDQPTKAAAKLSSVPMAPLPAGGRSLAPGSAPTFDPLKDRAGMQWPKVVRQIIPSYTPAAMRAKKQGTVGMEIVILEDGSVGQTRVTRSLDKGLDEQAQIVARYWLFEAGTKDGKPVATRVSLDLEFRLH